MQAMIIGAGQVGSAIIGALTRENVKVIAVDSSQTVLDSLNDVYDIQTICGSGSDPEVLKDANVNEVDLVVAVTNSDEVNIVACAISRINSPHAKRVARIRSKSLFDSMATLESQGFRIEYPINPERLTAERLMRIVASPFAVDMVDFGSELLLLGVRIPPKSPISGMTFADIRMNNPELRMLVTTRVRDNDNRIPGGADNVQVGDLLYIVISPGDIYELGRMLGLPSKSVQRVTIAGGSGIAELLAQNLEDNSKVSLKIIETDSDRADHLAETFTKTLVLKGSPTDENLLVEENIKECDVFVSALASEEINILTALNAKRLGARRVIALTNQSAYIPIIVNAGVDAVVSPKALAISTILQHLRKVKVNQVITFSMGGDTIIMEFEAVPTSEVVGHPLKTIRFPEGAIVGAVIRNGKSIIPGGDEILQPGDRVFVFAQTKAIKRLEKMMAVSFDFY